MTATKAAHTAGVNIRVWAFAINNPCVERIEDADAGNLDPGRFLILLRPGIQVINGNARHGFTCGSPAEARTVLRFQIKTCDCAEFCAAEARTNG